jgi:GDP-4-dehydro-6-deoxy-D-mannose reductase
MTPARVLVTGASGFVGTHLMAALARAFPKAELIGTGHGDHAGMVPLDIADAEAVATLVRRVRPEACIHLAAVTAVPAARQEPGRAWQANLHGTLNVARALMDAVPDCPLVFSSSAEIYGASFASGEALAETALLAPANTYAATKAAADLALGALGNEGLRVIRLRAFNHTGPGQTDQFVVPAFARQIARIEAGLQEPVLRVGSLTPSRDFLDVRDVCEAYVACVQRSEALPPAAIFNIASGTPRPISTILSDLIALTDIKPEVESATNLRRTTEIAVAAGDATAARSMLGWTPAIPWDQTLADVLADWRVRVRC